MMTTSIWSRPGFTFSAATVARIEALTPRAGPGQGAPSREVWRRYGLGSPCTVGVILRGLAREGRVIAEADPIPPRGSGPAATLYRRPETEAAKPSL